MSPKKSPELPLNGNGNGHNHDHDEDVETSILVVLVDGHSYWLTTDDPSPCAKDLYVLSDMLHTMASREHAGEKRRERTAG